MVGKHVRLRAGDDPHEGGGLLGELDRRDVERALDDDADRDAGARVRPHELGHVRLPGEDHRRVGPLPRRRGPDRGDLYHPAEPLGGEHPAGREREPARAERVDEHVDHHALVTAAKGDAPRVGDVGHAAERHLPCHHRPPNGGVPPRNVSYAAFWRCLQTDWTIPTAMSWTSIEDEP